MSALIDLTGKPFGRWIVLRRAPNRGRHPYWVCQCICGTVREVCGSHLSRGKSLSCRCLQKEEGNNPNSTHGLSKSPEYAIWNAMKNRCLNPNDTGYPNYGGRGITVCEAWQTSFEAFFTAMGPRPSYKHSIERRNNDGPYSPENCYWATKNVQARNTRGNHRVTIDGHTACLAEWLEINNISSKTYEQRIKHGWSIEQALTTPVKRLFRTSHTLPAREDT